MTATKIEWTDATWNPTTGCDRTSPGCDHCYALTMAKRLKGMGSAHYQNDGDPRTSGPGFGVTVHADALELPLRWRRPRRVFVNSMSDLFHPDVPEDFVARVWEVMLRSTQHTFQVLTKRPTRMRRFLDGSAERPVLPALFTPLPNVWLGTSIESDAYTFRANHLRATPAAVRFLSLEPLLGPLPSLDLTGIDWVIVGGESGRGARPMHPDWVRDIRDRCVAGGVPFFFKQWGEWLGFGVDVLGESFVRAGITGRLHKEWKDERGRTTGAAVRVGKKAAGRVLDGHTWDEMPVL